MHASPEMPKAGLILCLGDKSMKALMSPIDQSAGVFCYIIVTQNQKSKNAYRKFWKAEQLCRHLALFFPWPTKKTKQICKLTTITCRHLALVFYLCGVHRTFIVRPCSRCSAQGNIKLTPNMWRTCSALAGILQCVFQKKQLLTCMNTWTDKHIHAKRNKGKLRRSNRCSALCNTDLQHNVNDVHAACWACNVWGKCKHVFSKAKVVYRIQSGVKVNTCSGVSRQITAPMTSPRRHNRVSFVLLHLCPLCMDCTCANFSTPTTKDSSPAAETETNRPICPARINPSAL